jgi:hypothetical protein
MGCAAHRLDRRLVPPNDLTTLDHRSPYLKVHAKDGGVYVLSEWSADSAGTLVRGTGMRLGPSRDTVGRGSFTVPVDSVSLFETNVIMNAPGVTALAVITGISVAITIACLTNPKACFGSCPTFYAAVDGAPSLQAEGFSASIAPALEATDVDALYRVEPRSRTLAIEMKNEALETHVVRFVHLLAAPRAPDERVFATDDRRFWRVRRIQEPRRATAPEGEVCAALAAFDGIERASLADSTDLAARETVTLEFPSLEGRGGLVIGARQTLMTTYLFYQPLAWLGRSAGSALAGLERGETGAGAIGRTLGGIEVRVRGADGRWQRVGVLNETGPLAADVKVVPLPPLPSGPVAVELSLARGAWRLDYVALAEMVAEIEPLRLDPERVLRGGREDASALARLRDPGHVLVTTRGDAYTLVYRLPDDFERRELFLESRGYYLEWMREEWLAEEDPARAIRSFVDPARTLREVAPDFKRYESKMEALFWSSRYARP